MRCWESGETGKCKSPVGVNGRGADTFSLRTLRTWGERVRSFRGEADWL